MKRQIALDADVYDTLELGALAFDGIGAGSDFLRLFDSGDWLDYPVACNCAHGIVAQTRTFGLVLGSYGEGNILLDAAGIDRHANDMAVAVINHRRGVLLLNARVSFEDWCRELNVVRGPSKPAELWAGMPV